MKHKVKGRSLGRVRKQRVALLRTLTGSLIMSGKIQTTEAKAKEIKPLMDRLLTKALKAEDDAKKVTVLRELKKDLPSKAAHKLVDELTARIGKRRSGFTRIIKLAPRKSDSARMAVIEFVD